MLSKFEYQQIDLSKPSLRLLRVLPIGDDGIITCEIVTKVLPLVDKYAALSYHWGDSTGPKLIKVVSHEQGTSGYVWVRQNLHKFLRRASNIHARPYFWIDALCIDQHSVKERNHQVQQMGQIYKGAQKVLIWLGDDPGVVEVFETARAFRHEPPQECMSNMRSAFDHAAHNNRNFYRSERRLWQHEYWSRVWIIQEILLADSLHVAAGHVCVSWSYFTNIVQAINGPSLEPDANLDTCQPRHKLMQYSSLMYILTNRIAFRRLAKHTTLPRLAQVLPLCATARCADIRDKIYGILSLVDNGIYFPVDYDLDVFDLFCRVWSFFQLWEWGGATALLMFMLRIEADSTLQGITCNNIQPSQALLAYPGTLNYFKITETWNQTRASRYSRKKIHNVPECQECGEAFGSLPLEYLSSRYRVWCTRLGTNFRYHIIFKRSSFRNPLATSRYEALGFIFHNKPSDIFKAQFISLGSNALDKHGQDAIIAQSASIKPGTKDSVIFLSHATFLRLVMHTNSHQYRPSKLLSYTLNSNAFIVEDGEVTAPAGSQFSPFDMRDITERYKAKETERHNSNPPVLLWLDELRQSALESMDNPFWEVSNAYDRTIRLIELNKLHRRAEIATNQ